MEQTKNPELIRWTNASIYCYERNCDCEGCIYKEKLETKCVMKNTVFELFKKFGKPEDKYSRLKKKELFVTNYYGEEIQKLKLLKKMKELKHEILSDDGDVFDIFSDILNIIEGLILFEDCEKQIKEMQMIKLEREINYIHQKNFKLRKSNSQM